LELEDWVKTFVQNKQPLRSVLFSNSDAISLG
jgi:hypothetical protein